MKFDFVIYTALVVLSVSAVTPQQSKGVGQGPRNQARLEGLPVILQCESTGGTSRISWYEYASGNPYGRLISDQDDISEGHPNAEHYAIIHDDAISYNLLINSTVMDDGGKYRCMDQEQPQDENAYAELIMISGDPVCVSTTAANGEVIEGHTYSIECSVDYRGNVAPTMTWSGPGPFIVQPTTTNDTVHSKLTFTVSMSMNGNAFSCKTNFTADDFDNLPTDSATNVPAYENIYEGAALDVYSTSCPDATSMSTAPTTCSPCTTNAPTPSTTPLANVTLMQEVYSANALFNKSWDIMKAGFKNGNSFWLGNDAIHTLTKDGNCRASFEIQEKSNHVWYVAEYDTFILGDESTDYQLTVSGYSGNVTDNLYYHNGMKYSTYDRDNSKSSNCIKYYGAWWHDNCCLACLSGSGSYFRWYPIADDFNTYMPLLMARVWLYCDN